MAVGAGHAAAPVTASSRRLSIGANVAVAITLAAALLVAVNWIASLKNIREDLATVGNYGISDRTKRIVGGYGGTIEVSTLYAPDEDDQKQQERIDRLTDYFDELVRFAPNVRVSSISTDSQREKLVAQISATFGSEADKHRLALESYDKLSAELLAEIKSRLEATQAMLGGESWLGEFPVFANIVSTFRGDSETLTKAAEAIKDLIPPGGIPKYAAAAIKAKETLTTIRGHMDAVQRALGESAKLADETTKPDSAYVATLRDVAAQAGDLVASLSGLVGKQGDPPLPNAGASLKTFADRGVEVGAALDKLVGRVDDFARKYPMVTQHPDWAASVQMGPLLTRMEVADVLKQAGETLAKARLIILGVIDGGDPQQLLQAVEDARGRCAILDQNAGVCRQLLTDLADSLSKMDEPSKSLLEAGRQSQLFGDKIAAIDKLSKEIEALPELKLGTAADALKEPNTIVIQANNKIRVVGYSEAFPIRTSIGANPEDAEDQPRTFNGDSAISSAILAMTHEGPFATVVLTAFEPPAPPQRNQFTPPPARSWVPLDQLSELRKRLEAANFKVVDWNLATTGEPPKPDEGSKNVYVLLPPPPPSPPNPFGGGQSPDEIFGEAQRAQIRALLDQDAAALFLGTWEVRSSGFFGGPPITPPYGYGPLLDADWGISVHNNQRVVWIEPTLQKADSFRVVPRRFIHMPVSGFTDNDVGSPLKGCRFLVTDCCTLEAKDSPPEGVRASSVLRVPNSPNYCGAELDELIRIIEMVQDPSGEGVITLRPPPANGPFDVMLTAQRKSGDQGKGRIAVLGFGASVRDDFLQQPVMAEGEQLRLEPPPTENVDLIANSLYWLVGQPELISRGPVPVPRIEQISVAELRNLRVFVWGVWPVLVFIPGVFLWYVRRR